MTTKPEHIPLKEYADKPTDPFNIPEELKKNALFCVHRRSEKAPQTVIHCIIPHGLVDNERTMGVSPPFSLQNLEVERGQPPRRTKKPPRFPGAAVIRTN